MKVSFKVEDKEYAVVSPTNKQLREATHIYNRAFASAVRGGALLREEMEKILEERDIWNDDIAEKFRTKQEEFAKLRVKLAELDSEKEVKEVTKLSNKLAKLRTDMERMIAPKISSETNTAQGQAEQERFNFLVSVCTVYNDTEKQVYSSYDDFEEKIDDDIAQVASEKFGRIFYGFGSDS